MWRRLASLAASAALALTVLVTTGHQVALATVDYCAQYPAVYEPQNDLPAGKSVYSEINISDWDGSWEFLPCRPGSYDPGDLVYGFVSITPSNVNCGVDCIVQIGIVRCDITGYGLPCGGTWPSIAPRFAWAYGGCGGVHPSIQDIGPADIYDHTYDIKAAQTSGGAWVWDLYIDNTWKKTLYFSNTAVSCWTSGQYGSLIPSVMGEVHNYGGSLGSYANGSYDLTHQLYFANAKYAASGFANLNPGWSGSCTAPDDGRHHCRVINSNSVRMYSGT